MCLTLELFQTPENALKTAETDIVCYKVVKSFKSRKDKSEGDKETYLSLHQNFEYAIGKRYQNNLESGLGFRRTHVQYYDVYDVYEGFHSYKHQEHALMELAGFFSHKNIRILAVQCTIPKGCKYVENDNYYASDAIVLDKIIGEYDFFV